MILAIPKVDVLTYGSVESYFQDGMYGAVSLQEGSATGRPFILIPLHQENIVCNPEHLGSQRLGDV